MSFKICDNGTIENVSIIPMTLIHGDDAERSYTFGAKVELTTGGDYGYTFRVMPKHDMLTNAANMNLVKWVTS